MKKTLPYLYLAGSLAMPVLALAHGDGDGHEEMVAVPDPSGRKYVIIGVAVVFALMIGWFAWSKIKSKPPQV